MKNRCTDLNDHLFAQMERLTDEDLTGEQLHTEVKRAHAVVAVADQIVRNAAVMLSAAKMADEFGGMAKVPAMLEGKKP